jgi:hypothetical protein
MAAEEALRRIGVAFSMLGLRPAEVAKQIGVKVKEWPGNCYAISEMILKAGLVPGGKLRYGHYLGPIVKGTMFSNKPIVNHGWLDYEDEEFGRIIVDATKWVFEGKKPYIYQAPDFKGHYDLGGNGLLMSLALSRSAPKYNPNDRQFELPGAATGRAIRVLLANHQGDHITDKQAHYVANQPLQFLGPHAKAIFEWLIAKGLGAFIPMDNRNYIMKG